VPERIREWIDDRNVHEEVDYKEYAFRVAVYRRYLQSVLYQLYRPELGNQVPELRSDKNWHDQFAAAFEETGEAGFKTTVVDKLTAPAPSWLNRTLIALHGAAYSFKSPAAAFAGIYESLISQVARRDLGQFATPEYIGDFLASWAVRDANDTVLDPGVGAGQLASRALDKKLELGAENPLSDITGVDVDETAVAMAATTLKLVDGTGSAKLHQTDFIEFSPRSFENGEYSVTSVDGIITNPPYSRHQVFDDDQKSRMNEIVSLESGNDISLRTPLYGYFLIHAAEFLESGGRLAAIVPSRFLDTAFGRDLKRFLLEGFDIYAIIQFKNGFDVFGEAKTSPAILLLERDGSKTENSTKFISLSSWPADIDATALLSKNLEELPEIEMVRTVAQGLLSPTERWSHYLEDDDILDEQAMEEFGDIANIGRGIATGDNDYFCLSQSEIEEFDIPEKYLQRIIRSAHGLRKIDLQLTDWKEWRDDDEDIWLLYCYSGGEPIEKSDIDDEDLLDYLKLGEESSTTEGYLVSGRDPWYKVEKQTPAPILAKYMNRTGFLFMRNHAKLRSLNNVHTISPKEDYEDERKYEALLAYLNSRVLHKPLTKRSEDYYGLKKIEIGQLESVPVINPTKLDEEKLESLSTLYEKLRKARRREEDEKKILDELDRELEPMLDWADNPQDVKYT
jgi:tRNA1(Val) A37 N6-methylase TrmN6